MRAPRASMVQMELIISISEMSPTPRVAQNITRELVMISTSAVDFQVTNYISIAAIVLIVAWVFCSLSMPVVLGMKKSGMPAPRMEW